MYIYIYIYIYMYIYIYIYIWRCIFSSFSRCGPIPRWPCGLPWPDAGHWRSEWAQTGADWNCLGLAREPYKWPRPPLTTQLGAMMCRRRPEVALRGAKPVPNCLVPGTPKKLKLKCVRAKPWSLVRQYCPPARLESPPRLFRSGVLRARDEQF